VPFVPGDNVVDARGEKDGRSYSDRVVIHFTYYPPVLADASVPFRELGVDVGTEAQFADASGPAWTGDQPYQPGGFGYVGGEPQRIRAIITGTKRIPLYFTYREGLTAYRFDVPDGDYAVDLLFAEPKETEAGRRVFSVAVNGVPVAERLDLAVRAGKGVAVPITVATKAKGTGIIVSFEAITGAPILNAVRVRRR
jgi:beta-galactosidase